MYLCNTDNNHSGFHSNPALIRFLFFKIRTIFSLSAKMCLHSTTRGEVDLCDFLN